MATKKDDKPQTVSAFVLSECVFGAAGAVVELSPADAKAGVEVGMLDLSAAAVKAASGG